jgi:N4-gp56 family major capsid protein
VTSPATRGDLKKIYRQFKRSRAREIGKIIKPSAQISTMPVAPAYFVIGHTDCDADIRAISGFLPAEQYSDPSKALPGEIGKVDQFRFVLTPMVEPWLNCGASGTTYLVNGDVAGSAANCDVYPLIVLAADAYSIVPLQGANAVTPIVINPKPGSGDPLGQRGFVAWKTYQGSVILNHQWIARLEVAATANPS